MALYILRHKDYPQAIVPLAKSEDGNGHDGRNAHFGQQGAGDFLLLTESKKVRDELVAYDAIVEGSKADLPATDED